jgi:hypothetical protein
MSVPPAPLSLVAIVPPVPEVGGGGGGGGGVLQVPVTEPSVVTQLEPRQQSPVIVQLPPAATQLSAAQRSTPLSSAVHGLLSQQSSADAQVSPAARQVLPRPLQRGTPNRSSWHTPELPGAAQQSLREDEMLQA